MSSNANSGWHICADGYERWALVVGLVEGRHQGADSRTAISGRRRDMGQRGQTIRKANPLIGLDAHTRKVILEERDAARGDSSPQGQVPQLSLELPYR